MFRHQSIKCVNWLIYRQNCVRINLNRIHSVRSKCWNKTNNIKSSDIEKVYELSSNKVLSCRQFSDRKSNVETFEKAVGRKKHASHSKEESSFEQAFRLKEFSTHGESNSTVDEKEWTETFGTLAEEGVGPSKLVSQSFSRSTVDGKKFEDDEEEEKPYRRLAPFRRHTPSYYGRMMEKLAEKGKIYEAIEVLETKMLKEDRVMPTEYTFTTLIGCLGRVGYTKKAFQLYNKMKKFGIKPAPPCYTALFNACSNSPWKQDGLQRAHKLRKLLKEKEIELNTTNYAAMIKAFGMCGDMLTAFQVVDEVSAGKLNINDDIFSSLLVTCISDKEAGLKHFIEVWRRMRKRRIAFETKHYNLLLRAVRDCGVGSTEFANTLLRPGTAVVPSDSSRSREDRVLSSGSDSHQETGLPDKKGLKQPPKRNPPERDDDVHIPWWKYDYSNTQNPPTTSINSNKRKLQDMNSGKSLESAGHSNNVVQTAIELENSEAIIETQSESDHFDSRLDPSDTPHHTSLLVEESKQELTTTTTQPDAAFPNLLNPRVRFYENVLSITDVSTSEKRLGLFGGLPGILSHMEKDDCKPDIKTFMQLLEMIPSTLQAEDELLSLAQDKYGVKLDTDFVNMVIRRRNLRKDYREAKELLPWMSKKGLSPNVMTFACLGLACIKKEFGLQLLKDMEIVGIKPTITIYRTLITRRTMDFWYVLEIMNSMKKHNVLPDRQFLTVIEKKRAKANSIIVEMEKGRNVPALYKTNQFRNGFSTFNKYYKQWLNDMSVDLEKHPWVKFQEPTPEDAKKHPVSVTTGH